MKDKKAISKKYKMKHVVARGKSRQRNDTVPDNVNEEIITNEEASLNSMSEISGESLKELELVKLENDRLRKLNLTMQRENNKVINLAREGRIDAFDDSFRTTVVSVTKHVVYPRCPYVSNAEQLDKCMLLLATELDLQESKKAGFCINYKHTVNSAIAAKRNADVQMIRKEMKGNVNLIISLKLHKEPNIILIYFIPSILNYIIALGHEAPTYDKIKNLRLTIDEEKKQAVFLFYKHIVPCVSGKKTWKKQFHHVTISSAVTVSLEALALWIVHNYEGKWMGNENEGQALYTGLTKGNKMYTGWDNNGIEKYNEMCIFVKNNRMEGKAYDDEFQARLIAEHEEKNLKKQGKSQDAVPIVCFDDLDEKLGTLPNAVYNTTGKQYGTGVPEYTVLHGNSDVASTVSRSTASTAYCTTNSVPI